VSCAEKRTTKESDVNSNVLVALAAGLLTGPMAAQAALVDRGGGMIYDDVLKITWLKDANYAKTSGYDADGIMKWATANAWANALTYGGFDDWRLPTTGTDPICTGACTNSELGHMFYNNMGATSGQSIHLGSNSANLSLFVNVAPLPPGVSGFYWSSTENSPGSNAWSFNTNGGGQSVFGEGFAFYAWAVRDGDVVSTVPLPAAAWLLLSGLAGLGVLGRRRKR
jgi:Protein of unknown function (DUF1566)